MIVFDSSPSRYRGTIEVYCADRPYEWQYGDPETPEWRWRCKSNNHTILASGQGYSRRAGALNAINAMYSLLLATADYFTDDLLDSPGDIAQYLVVPWRLVIHDRHGNTTTGAVY